MSDKKGRLFIISSPSGGGKGTVIGHIMDTEPELSLSISATTRKPREGEEHGVSYYFITKEQFEELAESGAFLEHAKYIDEYYGTPKSPIDDCIYYGRDVLLEIEVQGARQVMEQYPEAISVFIVPPDMQTLENRLRGRRTESEDKLKARLDTARTELEEKIHYNHVVVNDDAKRAAEEIMEIINKSKGEI
ncbi:MAG: guanylate kinase [Oscillospiraceae bacterium]|nr:guanylate kinase [Oscillospiraceae bacterium]